MFSGIIEEVGIIKNMISTPTSKILTINCKKILNDTDVGDSISINGVCLTMTRKSNQEFDVDIVEETLRCTSLNKIEESSRINLERSLKYNERIGGHLVQGHVDGLAKVKKINKTDKWTEIKLSIIPEYKKYCIKKGSIAVDGVSLTIAELTSSGIKVALIPHTLDNTILSEYKIDQFVNIEFDIMGKYIENFFKD